MNNPANILIVDDEEVVRLSHLRSLQSVNCTARVAADGEKALEVMEQQPIDVVLLDIRMPDLDGMEVLKIIKHRWPESEVVVITGYPTIEAAKEATEVIKAANDAMNQKRWALRSDHESPGVKQ
jgi:DNA-binding NtrC family response regulator